MTQQLDTTVVIGSNYADPEARATFDVVFEVFAESLREHGITTAQVIFVGGVIQHADEPIDLTLPAAQLTIPTLEPGNVLDIVLSSFVEDQPPSKVVVVSSLHGVNPWILGKMLYGRRDISFLFALPHDTEFEVAQVLFGASRQTCHVSVVSWLDPSKIVEQFDSPYMHFFKK